MSILDTLYEINRERIKKGKRVWAIHYPEDEKAAEEEKYRERKMIIEWDKKARKSKKRKRR